MKTSHRYLPLFVLTSLSFLFACQQQESEQLVVTEIATSRIDSTLQSYVSSRNIAGVSALIFEKGEEVYFNSFGYADIENQKPMDRQTRVRIYSMTKPITGTALMHLWQQGKFDLDDPLEKYAPEFSDMKVYQGVDDNGEMILTDADRPITIRDITRHTAGFPNRNDIPGLSELMAEKNARSFENSLTEMAEKMGETPLWFQPGTQWEYGLSVDVQAFLVERISGQPYAEYVQENVLGPLALSNTSYFVPEDEREEVAVLYTRKGEGQLEITPDSIANKFNFNRWPLSPGGFGLVSTIDDYMTFARMLVGKGEVNGTRILDAETVELMATNHLPDSISERSWLPSKGRVGFGIDFAVRTEAPQSAEEMNGVPGEFFWDGAASTLFWVDPQNELVAVLFVQLFPYDGIGLHKNFKDAVYGKYTALD